MLPKQYDIQTLRVVETEDEFRKAIWNKHGLIVTSMIRFFDNYIFVGTLGTGWQSQITVSVWHPEKYDKLGENGKFVIGIYKHDKLWELHLAANTGITDQEITKLSDFASLKNHIQNQWQLGYSITDLLAVDGEYYVVTSKGLGWKQLCFTDKEYAENKLIENSKKDYFLTEIMKVEDTNLYVMSKNIGFKEQYLEYSPKTDRILKISNAIISDEGLDGFQLSFVKEINGRLLFSFLK